MTDSHDIIPHNLLRTPTLEEIKIAQSIIQISGVEIVGFGSPETARQASDLLDQFGQTNNITIGSLPETPSLNIVLPEGVQLDADTEVSMPTLSGNLDRTNGKTNGIS